MKMCRSLVPCTFEIVARRAVYCDDLYHTFTQKLTNLVFQNKACDVGD